MVRLPAFSIYFYLSSKQSVMYSADKWCFKLVNLTCLKVKQVPTKWTLLLATKLYDLSAGFSLFNSICSCLPLDWAFNCLKCSPFRTCAVLYRCFPNQDGHMVWLSWAPSSLKRIWAVSALVLWGSLRDRAGCNLDWPLYYLKTKQNLYYLWWAVQPKYLNG